MWGVSTTFAVQLRAEHRLIQHGLYAFVPHPMYLGYLLTLVGVALVYRTWATLLLFVVCLAAFYQRARREEQALIAMFGDEWRAYEARTRFFFPFLY